MGRPSSVSSGSPVKNDSTDFLGEGSNAASYDLGQSRFALNDNRVLCDQASFRKRQAWGGLVALSGLWVALIAANTFTDPPISVFWIYWVAFFLTLALVLWAFWRIATQSKELRNLLNARKKLRDAEKDARMRLSAEADRSILWNYHSDAVLTIDEYRLVAARNRRVGNWFQGFVIVVSVAVSLLATASGQFPGLQWVAVVASFLVAAATSLSGYFKFKERGVNMQRAADDLEYEFNSAELGINSYRALGAEVDRLREFAERSEKIKLDQRKREQQLEQGPQVRGVQGSEGG